METKFAFSGKLWSEISAIVSSILTNLIYEELTSTEFELITTGEKNLVVQLNDGEFGKRIAVILGIFFCLWFAIYVFVPVFLELVDRVRCHNMKGFKKSKVVSIFERMRKKVIEVSAQFSTLSAETSFVLLYSSEIAQIINSMYITFCPRTKHLNKIVKSSFRGGATVYDIGRYISPYEFDALLNELEKLVEVLLASSDSSVLLVDSMALKEEISELKNVTRS